jgi:hypothetical protein
VEIAETLVGLVELVELAVSVELVVSVELAESVELAVSVELVAGIVRPRCRRVVADEATGSTVRNTAGALRIETVRPQTDLEERRAVIRSPIGRPVPDSRLDGRAAISLATAAQEPVPAIGGAAQEPATGPGAEGIA